MDGRTARRLNNLERTLAMRSIMQLLKGANRPKITRVCRELLPMCKPYVYHQSGGESPNFLLLPRLSEWTALYRSRKRGTGVRAPKIWHKTRSTLSIFRKCPFFLMKKVPFHFIFIFIYLGTVAPSVHENCFSGGRGIKRFQIKTI